MSQPFAIGQAVRYKPGVGTYGYEDALEDDGQLPGIVLGYSVTGRVQVALTLRKRGGSRVKRTVHAASLQAAGAAG
jgi:hypothetical protein